MADYVEKVAGATIVCDGENCVATRTAHGGQSLLELRQVLTKSYGWLCDDDLDKDFCELHAERGAARLYDALEEVNPLA